MSEKKTIIVIPDPESMLIGVQFDAGQPILRLNMETACTLVDALLLAMEMIRKANEDTDEIPKGAD
jgi:hypothetical protein